MLPDSSPAPRPVCVCEDDAPTLELLCDHLEEDRLRARRKRGCSRCAEIGWPWAIIAGLPAWTRWLLELGASPFHVDAADTCCFAGLCRFRGAGARRARLRAGRTSACRSPARSSRPARLFLIAPFAINVRAHAVLCGAAAPHLRAAGGGATPHRLQLPLALGAQAGAVRGVTKKRRSRARSHVTHSGEGIRVNALCPGWINTPFTRAAPGEFRGSRALSRGGAAARAAGAHRHALAGGYFFCLFPPRLCTAYMTGHALVADGGEALPGSLAPPTRTTASPIRCRIGIVSAGQRTAPPRQRAAAEPKLACARRARGDARGAAAGARAWEWDRASGARRADSRRAESARVALVARAGRARPTVRRRDAGGIPRGPLPDGTGANLGGGTRSRVSPRGFLFGVFNDVVTATRSCCASAAACGAFSSSTSTSTRATRGTRLWRRTTRVFTFSLNDRQLAVSARAGRSRARSAPRGTRDAAYLDALAEPPARRDRPCPRRAVLLPGRRRSVRGRSPGRLALTRAGLAGRDQLVRAAWRG